MRKVQINYRTPQCQHVLEGRCGQCAYPTMARRTRYVEHVKTERGKEAAHEAMRASRRRITGGGKRHRKELRRQRLLGLMTAFPRQVSAYARA